MASLVAVGAVATFALLLVLTAIQQLCLCRDSQKPFITNELLNIFIPSWVFFAPNPCVVTFHLLSRVKHVDGNLSCWKEVPTCGPRCWYNCFWNPEKRLRKAFFDLNTTIRTYAEQAKQEHQPHAVELTLAYLTLLHRLSLIASPLAAEIQFIIMESDAVLDTRAVTFISNWHRVTSAACDGTGDLEARIFSNGRG
jgi:hypothetical protein